MNPVQWRGVGAMCAVGVVVLLAAMIADVASRGRTGAALGSQTTRDRSTPTTQSARAPRDFVAAPIFAVGEESARSIRIVSTAPATTEICCALGLRGNLVGRSRFCEYPPDVRDVPAVGGLSDFNIELVVSIKPDVVLVSGTSQAISDRLRQHGIRFESLPDRSLDDLFCAIERIGALAERPLTAKLLCGNIRADLAALDDPRRGGDEARASGATTRVAEERGDRVLFVTGVLSDPPAPPYAAGPGSFYDELLLRAGAKNVLGERRDFGVVAIEAILSANPDVIIELDPNGMLRPNGDADAAVAWGKLGRLRAVESGRVRVIKGPEHYILGPRIGGTYAAIVRALQKP